jgi:hypothetical protein
MSGMLSAAAAEYTPAIAIPYGPPPVQPPQTTTKFRRSQTFYPGLPSVPSTGVRGLGLADDASVTDPVTAFLLAHPNPSSTDVANFLKAQPETDRTMLAQQLIAQNVPSATVSAALNWLDTTARWKAAMSTIGGVLAIASAAASGYHGYRRNNSLVWAGVWFGAGMLFPIFTPVVALAQGFGKRKEH